MKDMATLVKSGVYCPLDALALMVARSEWSALNFSEPPTLHLTGSPQEGYSVKEKQSGNIAISVEVSDDAMTLTGDRRTLDILGQILGGRLTIDKIEWLSYRHDDYSSSEDRLSLLGSLSKDYPDAGGADMLARLDFAASMVSTKDDRTASFQGAMALMNACHANPIAFVADASPEDIKQRLLDKGYILGDDGSATTLFPEKNGDVGLVIINDLFYSPSREYANINPTEFSGKTVISIMTPGKETKSDTIKAFLSDLRSCVVKENEPLFEDFASDRLRNKAIARGYANLNALPRPDHKADDTIWTSKLDTDLSMSIPVTALCAIEATVDTTQGQMTPSDIICHALKSALNDDSLTITLKRDAAGDPDQDSVIIHDGNRRMISIVCADPLFCTEDGSLKIRSLPPFVPYDKKDVLDVISEGYLSVAATRSSFDEGCDRLAKKIRECLTDALEAVPTQRVIEQLKQAQVEQNKGRQVKPLTP